ncbi:unnamed protein product [Orchesella dallaii]|uniref:Transmembrane protein n=1 Tax=Orchesella dallaii TaxID=48710 RepID=A0ABP1S7X2_9HEXA
MNTPLRDQRPRLTSSNFRRIDIFGIFMLFLFYSVDQTSAAKCEWTWFTFMDCLDKQQKLGLLMPFIMLGFLGVFIIVCNCLQQRFSSRVHMNPNHIKNVPETSNF